MPTTVVPGAAGCRAPRTAATAARPTFSILLVLQAQLHRIPCEARWDGRKRVRVTLRQEGSRLGTGTS